MNFWWISAFRVLLWALEYSSMQLVHTICNTCKCGTDVDACQSNIHEAPAHCALCHQNHGKNTSDSGKQQSHGKKENKWYEGSSFSNFTDESFWILLGWGRNLERMDWLQYFRKYQQTIFWANHQPKTLPYNTTAATTIPLIQPNINRKLGVNNPQNQHQHLKPWTST